MLAHPSRPVDQNHATYDGKQLRRASDGVVLGRNDGRRVLVTHVVVCPGVTAVHSSAFSLCTALSSVSFPEGLITIQKAAFFGCTALTSVSFPEGLTEIGNCAFYGCTSLFSVSFPEGITEIRWWAFFGCTSLFSVSFPEGLTTIGRHAFTGCVSLSSIFLPSGLTSAIGDSAFDGCTLLSLRSRTSGHHSVVSYLRFISSRANRRYAVLAALKRLRDELYARQAKRARRAAVDGAVMDEEDEEVMEEEVLGEQADFVLRGTLAFDIIHSDDLWRHILEFV